MAGVDWKTSTVEAGGTKVHLKRGGKGRPLLVLHHETGTLDDLPFYDALAAHYDVLVPHHPGYSRSERPTWPRCTASMPTPAPGCTCRPAGTPAWTRPNG